MDEPAAYEWSTGPVCGVDNCPATRYIRNADGTKSCENGHVRNDVLYDDDAEYDPGGRTTRRKKVKVEKRKLPVGIEQRRLLVNSLQWVLRKQIWWLMTEKKFPPEFEALVQDLWLVRRMELSEYIDQDWNPESLSQPDEDLQFSQIGDGSDEGTSAPGRNMLATLPTLAQGVALLYLSCCILNLPVFLGDFLEWANERDFPYRDVHNLLPRDMWNRLNVNSKLLMPSRRQLMAVHLQKATLLVYRAYHDRLGLIMPPLNVPLCLYRMVERLALPFDIYPVVRRLAHMLREKFEFPTVFKHSSWPRGMPYLPLASLLIIAVKLLYPFDQKPRQPRSITEPTVAIVDWQAWLKEKEKLDEERTKHLPLTEEEGESIREEDMIEMSGEMMDRYMDWFAQRFITSTESQRLYQRSNLRENMNALFPLDGAATSAPQVETPTQDSEAEDDEDSEFEKPSHLDTPQWRNPRPRDPVGADRLRELTAERLDATQRTLVVQNIVPDSATEQNVKRPGADYKRFRETRELEGAAKAFHTAVAEMIGMPMPELLGGVIHYEWAIEKQWARPHRRKLKRRNDRLYDLS